MDEKKIEEVMKLVDALWDAAATQCTPSFQMKRRAEIEQALCKLLGEQQQTTWRNHFINLLELVEQHANFSNGVTDPTGTIDEGDVIGSEYLARFRALLGEQHG